MNALDKLLLETNKLTIDILVNLIKKQDEKIEALENDYAKLVTDYSRLRNDTDRNRIINTRLI